MSLYQELKRRNVFRVGIAYVLAAWVLLQIVDFATEVIAAPDWVLQMMFVVAMLGLPVALVISWVYEMTPEGIKLESQIDRTQSIAPDTGHKLDRVIIGFLALAVVVLLGERFVSFGEDKPDAETLAANNTIVKQSAVDPSVLQSPPTEQAAAAPTPADDGRESIAVLPFVNMSADPEQEYFSDGISEELLNVLVRIEDLRVPSRTSSFTYKGSGKKVTEIGRELQVDHVLEGSVRKAGNRIRVTAQLIDVDTDTHLWSETYTRELDDIFAVQDEIAQAIVEALKVTLGSGETQSLVSHSTENAEAYRLYLLGRHLWNQRTEESLLAAIEPFEQAVALDPQYDRAWAALADAYALLPEYVTGIREMEAYDRWVIPGMAAAGKALEINPESAYALTARAYMKLMYAFDHEGARADFLRAIELEPSYATALQWYGEFLAIHRDLDGAMAYMDRAIEADPLAVVIAHVKAWLLLGAGRYDEAIAQYKRAIPLDPGMPNLYGNLSLAHAWKGEYDLARENAIRWGQLQRMDPGPSIKVFDALENPQLKEEALQAIQDWEIMTDGAMDNAPYFMLLGEEQLALQSILRGFEQRDAYSVHVNRLVHFDSLREYPEYQEMLRQMNFEP